MQVLFSNDKNKFSVPVLREYKKTDRVVILPCPSCCLHSSVCVLHSAARIIFGSESSPAYCATGSTQPPLTRGVREPIRLSIFTPMIAEAFCL